MGPCAMGWGLPSPAGWGSPEAVPVPVPVPLPCRHRCQDAAALARWPHGCRRLPLHRLRAPARQPALADQDAQVGRSDGDTSCTRLGGGPRPCARPGAGCCGVGTGPSPGTAHPLSPLAGSMVASRRPWALTGTTTRPLRCWHRAPPAPQFPPGDSHMLAVPCTARRCHTWFGGAVRGPVCPGHGRRRR